MACSVDYRGVHGTEKGLSRLRLALLRLYFIRTAGYPLRDAVESEGALATGEIYWILFRLIAFVLDAGAWAHSLLQETGMRL